LYLGILTILKCTQLTPSSSPPFDFQVIQQRNEECDHTQFLIEEKESKEEDFYEDLDRFEENGTQESRISPYTFCKAFPFHIIFDRDLVVTQCGNAIYRVLPQVNPWYTSSGPDTRVTGAIQPFDCI
jgi:hypothetical protein